MVCTQHYRITIKNTKNTNNEVRFQSGKFAFPVERDRVFVVVSCVSGFELQFFIGPLALSSAFFSPLCHPNLAVLSISRVFPLWRLRWILLLPDWSFKLLIGVACIWMLCASIIFHHLKSFHLFTLVFMFTSMWENEPQGAEMIAKTIYRNWHSQPSSASAKRKVVKCF